MKYSMKINQLNKNGLKQGLWKEHYNSAGLDYIGEFENGRRHGSWEEYYISGEIYAKGQHQKGDRVGLWLFYRKTGELFLEVNYKGSLSHLASKSYLKDGRIEDQGFFNKVSKRGLWYARYF